jgi:Ca2+-binding RTX toxin-like protein
MVTLAPSAAQAAGCQFDPGTRHATAFAADIDTEVKLAADAGNLEANGVVCAALTAIETVTVDMAAKSGGRVVFDLSGGVLGPGFTDEGDTSSEIEFSITGMSTFGQIHVLGSSGNDGITFGRATVPQLNLNALADGATPDVDVTFLFTPLSTVVDAGAGDDVVSGAGVTSTATPYDGVMTVNAGAGSNQVTGGSGGDQISLRLDAVSSGVDEVVGGDGFDRLVLLADSAAINASISLDGVANDGVDCPGAGCEGDNVAGDFEVVFGSAASETLIGNDQYQAFDGGSGNDVLMGLGGPDDLACRTGTAFGGEGGDWLRPGPECESVSGGTGRDEVFFLDASKGVNVTLDGVANDGEPTASLNVMTNIEIVTGSPFGDTLVGNDKRNVLNGGAGRDDLSGAGGNDRLSGEKGNDTLVGGLGDDVLLGGAGDDGLDGGDDVDICKQGSGTGVSLNCE